MNPYFRQPFIVVFSLWLFYSVYNSPAFAEGSSANITFRHILQSQMEGLGYINAIAQDELGFMWFGGSNGLARYDGYRLKIYRFQNNKPGTLSHSYIYSLLVDREGALWIGTSRGLNRYNAQTDDFSVYRQPNPSTYTPSVDDIRSLFEDSKGHLWLGTRGGLFSFDRTHQTYHQYKIGNTASGLTEENVVWTITEDQKGAIWVANQQRGVSRLDLMTNSFNHFPKLSVDDEAANDVRRLYVDPQNQVWAATHGGGIFVFDRSIDRFNFFSHCAPELEKCHTVWDFAEDGKGNMWIGDGGGLSKLAAVNGAFERFHHEVSALSSPGNFVVNTLFTDRNGDVWAGYFPSGVDIIDQQGAAFHNYTHNPNKANSLADGGVISALEDEQGNIWVGAGYGLNYVDRISNTITRATYQPDNPDGLSGNTVLSIAKDSQQNLWLGIWSKGLNRLDKGSNQYRHYLPQKGEPNSLLGKEPWALLVDRQKRLWVGTESGINLYNPESDNFTHYLPRQDQMDGDVTLYTRALLEDSHGRIWVGSIRGLYQMLPESHSFTRYHRQEGNPASLSNDFVIALFEDSQQRLWVGTHGGGLNRFDPHTGKFYHTGISDGLPDNVITSIVEDNDGMLWLSSQQGLSRYDPDTGSIRNFNKHHGLSGNLFNRNTGLKTRDGKLFFGNSTGFVLFDPKELRTTTSNSKIVLTELRIFNQPVSHKQPDSPLQSTIESTRSIEIDHNQSMITFEFSALNFRSPQLSQYAYWLEGFDREWIHSGSRRYATYTNLDSGHYALHVKAANSDGDWSTQPSHLNLYIKPPSWKTTTAYVLYLITTLLVIFGVISVLVRRQSFSKEKMLGQRLEEVDKLKDDFLANVSHRLRTPLSNMIGLSEAILCDDSNNCSAQAQNQLLTILHNGKQLTALINEIIDYSQLADNKLKLNFQSVDLFVLTELVFSLVTPVLHPKPIRLINALSPNMPKVWADEERLQQILLNLVSNAIKYTHEGFITVSGEAQSSRIRVSVEDSGIGIAPDRLEAIFYPFQQADNNDSPYIEGTSLGLTVCRKLIELHNGSIEVRSALGSGSEFIFDLALAGAQIEKTNSKTEEKPQAPHYSRHRLEQSIAARATLQPVIYGKDFSQEALAIAPSPEHASDHTILIVDDDTVSRMVIKAMLAAHHYNVIEADSGAQALTQLSSGSRQIDLIILDVIMPGISGYDTCREIRKYYPLDSLPILFLSASNRDKDIVSGYGTGGSDFLSKPAASTELISKVGLHLKLTAHKRRNTSK